MTSTAAADRTAPAMESVLVWTRSFRIRCRIGCPIAKPTLDPRLPPITSTSTAPSGRATGLLIPR